MALVMTGAVELSADKREVWAKLNDPEVLRACIPGCQSLERVGENGFAAVARLSIGPVTATFKATVELILIDPPNDYRIAGAGEGGVAGFAKGGMNVRLVDAPNGCTLSYDVEASVGGKIAQLGGRLINGVAKKTADQFFAKFSEIVGSTEMGVSGATG